MLDLRRLRLLRELARRGTIAAPVRSSASTCSPTSSGSSARGTLAVVCAYRG
jgi:hypothetical protein